jgi:hypothetical protein
MLSTRDTIATSGSPAGSSLCYKRHSKLSTSINTHTSCPHQHIFALAGCHGVCDRSFVSWSSWGTRRDFMSFQALLSADLRYSLSRNPRLSIAAFNDVLELAFSYADLIANTGHETIHGLILDLCMVSSSMSTGRHQ